MKTVSSMIVLLACVYLSLTAQPKSDFAVVEKFQTSAGLATKSIETAMTAQECAEISNTLDNLENEFKNNKELLDNALYPENYTTIMADLRGRLLVRQHDLGIIETQVTHIAELETKIKDLSNQIAKLDGQNEKLAQDVQRLSQNVQKLTGDEFTSTTPIDSLRALIVQLRKGLQERDALIFSLVDSLFMQYDKNIADMKDVEKQGLMGKVERHGIFANVKRSLQDNLSFIEATNLKSADMLSITKQQQLFQSQWSGISPKLAILYRDKQKKNDVALVDSMLKQWSNKVEAATWRSLNMLFREKEIGVKEFTNEDEFVANLRSYIDLQIKNPDGQSKDSRYRLFTNFEENVWKTDLISWLPAFVETQKITAEQRKDIEDKIAEWRLSVQPGVPAYVYIIIVVVVLALGAFIWLKRKRSETAPEQNQ